MRNLFVVEDPDVVFRSHLCVIFMSRSAFTSSPVADLTTLNNSKNAEAFFSCLNTSGFSTSCNLYHILRAHNTYKKKGRVSCILLEKHS